MRMGNKGMTITYYCIVKITNLNVSSWFHDFSADELWVTSRSWSWHWVILTTYSQWLSLTPTLLSSNQRTTRCDTCKMSETFSSTTPGSWVSWLYSFFPVNDSLLLGSPLSTGISSSYMRAWKIQFWQFLAIFELNLKKIYQFFVSYTKRFLDFGREPSQLLNFSALEALVSYKPVSYNVYFLPFQHQSTTLHAANTTTTPPTSSTRKPSETSSGTDSQDTPWCPIAAPCVSDVSPSRVNPSMDNICPVIFTTPPTSPPTTDKVCTVIF